MGLKPAMGERVKENICACLERIGEYSLHLGGLEPVPAEEGNGNVHT